MTDQEISQIVGHLRSAGEFGNLSDADLQTIARTGRHLTVPEHWALMTEHTPADKAYLVISGEASVRQQGEEIARVGAGELIGEMALVNRKLRSATVVAESPLEVLHFTSEDIAQLSADVAGFGDLLRSSTAERAGE